MDNYLLDLMKSEKKHIWIGTKKPFSMDSVNIILCSNYRVSSSLHQKYNVVWYIENSFDDLGALAWRPVLDEMIRFIEKEGKLIIRVRKGTTPSLFNVKSFLWRRIGLSCDVEYETEELTKDSSIVVLDIHRKDIEIYRKKDWSFIVLTMGDKVKNVVKFLNSIRQYEESKNEIIVMGPQSQEYDRYDVKYADWSRFENSKYAEISAKKNAAIKMAKGTNVCIVHDRYVLENDYFKGFESYGYDFDYVTVNQNKLNGERFPSYMACVGYPTDMNPQSFDNPNIQIDYPMEYINGGLIVTKRKIIQEIGFNELLFWNQLEDVELSKCFADNGFPPRVNFISHATTLTIREEYSTVRSADECDVFNEGAEITKEKRREREYKELSNMLVQLYRFSEVDLSGGVGDVFGIDAMKSIKNNIDLYLKGFLYMLNNAPHIIIYGAGVYGKCVMDYCVSNNLESHIDSFAITDPPDGSQSYINGKPIYLIGGNQCSRDSMVLIAANSKLVSGMEEHLLRCGFKKYFVIDRTLLNLMRKELE